MCRWESRGYFRPQESAQGPPYTIPMPPPNVTGKLHMGHAMFATIQVRLLATLPALQNPCSQAALLTRLPKCGHAVRLPFRREQVHSMLVPSLSPCRAVSNHAVGCCSSSLGIPRGWPIVQGGVGIGGCEWVDDGLVSVMEL